MPNNPGKMTAAPVSVDQRPGYRPPRLHVGEDPGVAGRPLQLRLAVDVRDLLRDLRRGELLDLGGRGRTELADPRVEAGDAAGVLVDRQRLADRVDEPVDLHRAVQAGVDLVEQRGSQ